VTNTITVARPTYNDPEYFKGIVRGALNFYAGPHELKLGYTYNNAYQTTDATSLSNDLRAVFRDGVPDSVNTYNTPIQFSQHTSDHSLFVQDRWVPFRKLTLNVGLRFENFYSRQPAACQPQTIWVPTGQCFPATEGVPHFTGVVPRVSAIYDLFGNGKTALKTSFNQYRVQMGTSLLSQVSPIRVTNDTRSWRDLNGDFIPQVSELGRPPVTTSGPSTDSARASNGRRRASMPSSSSTSFPPAWSYLPPTPIAKRWTTSGEPIWRFRSTATFPFR
jgi:hypothetical protein